LARRGFFEIARAVGVLESFSMRLRETAVDGDGPTAESCGFRVAGQDGYSIGDARGFIMRSFSCKTRANSSPPYAPVSSAGNGCCRMCASRLSALTADQWPCVSLILFGRRSSRRTSKGVCLRLGALGFRFPRRWGAAAGDSWRKPVKRVADARGLTCSKAWQIDQEERRLRAEWRSGEVIAWARTKGESSSAGTAMAASCAPRFIRAGGVEKWCGRRRIFELERATKQITATKKFRR